MIMAIPMEVLDEGCRMCPQFKPAVESTQVYGDWKEILGYFVKCRCVNLPLCQEGRIDGKSRCSESEEFLGDSSLRSE